MAITLVIAIVSGATFGLLSSKLHKPDEMFEDKSHFAEVEYSEEGHENKYSGHPPDTERKV